MFVNKKTTAATWLSCVIIDSSVRCEMTVLEKKQTSFIT